MGFSLWSDIVYNEETGERSTISYMVLVAINSSEDAVTIPDYIKVGDNTYPVTYINGSYDLREGFNSSIKTLTIPSTVTDVYTGYNFFRYLDAIYMLGTPPEISGRVQVSKIYVCDRTTFVSYVNNTDFSDSSILPYGWDFEWVTVNVEKKGEFAETYLTQNNYDWGAVQYLKVTGNINDTDLSAIKNLTTLVKLDLSGTTITSVPENFMLNRMSLIDIKLPATLESIGDSAFKGCSALQSFDLHGITTIGSSVFYGCRTLPYINLSGVQTIGDYAFRGCVKLNDVDLSTVANVGSYAFADCTALKEVTVGNDLQNLDSGSFSNTAIEDITLPGSLTYIAERVFDNCKNLVRVVLPNSITSIGRRAFYDCSSLSSVSMETGISSIGESAFYGCTSLADVVIPSTVKSIGSSAFNNTGIKDFKCYAAVPPKASASFIGENMDMSRTYLYVPPFSKDFYRNTEYWSNFYLMRSIEDQIDYILVDRPLTINLEEEDNAVVANNPEIVLSAGVSNGQRGYNNEVGQLTATGEGTLSAGQMTVNATLAHRSYNSGQYCPTLINYADKMRADNVTINMSLYDYRSSWVWHFISLPYDVKVSDIVPSNDTYWVIRRYDSAARAAGETSETWVNLTNDDIMEAGKGYIISAVGGETYIDEWGYTRDAYPCLSFTSGNSLTKNNLFRSSDIIVPLTEYAAEFAHNRSWNLIGNPYPCYFDMHYLNEEFTAPVTVWSGSSYVAYSPVDDDLVLSPYEAFFVQCPLDATEMTFKEAGRLHSNDGKSLYKIASGSREIISAEDRNVFNFVISGENYEDRARIVLSSDAKLEYEIGRDASKFFAENSDNAQLYVNADVAYSINERPVNDGVATLGIRSAKENVYTLMLNGKYSDEWSVLLTDNEAGITIDLTKESYQFTSASNENSSRFTVKFILANNGQSGIDSIVADFGETTTVTVTATNGVVVYNGRLSDINVPTSGLYIISNGKETRKAILK